MFIHFHANVPSSFYICYIVSCWCFSDSLSLSLSLSLVSRSMTPKRKFTPSRNPLCFEVSSSSSPSDPTPSHVQFCDKKAKSDFLENFLRCDIHSKYQVILLEFSDIDLPFAIHNRGWESLCGVSVICPSLIIHEFYSNMHGFDYSIPQFVTCV